MIRVHSNHSLCPSIHKFTDLICSVHQDPRSQKVASVWAYMCSILRVHSNHSLFSSIPKFTDLKYVQYTKNPVVKKWLPFELISAVYWEYIVTIHIVCPYPNLLTLYVQYTKTLAVKNWLPFELIFAVYLEYIVTNHFFRQYPNLLTLYVQYTKTLSVKKWLPFELICAVYLE